MSETLERTACISAISRKRLNSPRLAAVLRPNASRNGLTRLVKGLGRAGRRRLRFQAGRTAQAA